MRFFTQQIFNTAEKGDVSSLCKKLALVAALLCCSSAYGEECIVSSSSGDPGAEGSLAHHIERVINDGACLADDALLRGEYKDYLAMSLSFHVIRWRQSMDIRLTEDLPSITGNGGRPVILRADPGVQVRIIGTNVGGIRIDINQPRSGGEGGTQQALPVGGATRAPVIEGTGGPVIIDNVTFAGFADAGLTMRSDGNAIIRSRILESGPENGASIVLTGRRNKIVATEITKGRGVGVLIGEGAMLDTCRTTVSGGILLDKNEIHHNAREGIVIRTRNSTLTENSIHDNGAGGVLVETESAQSMCLAKEGKPVPDTAWNKALIRRSLFWGNAGDAISVTKYPLMPPVDLIVVSPLAGNEFVLVGNVSRSSGTDYPWRDGRIDFASLEVEVFFANGEAQGKHYLLTTSAINPVTRQFTVHIPSPIEVEGQSITDPVFTATVVDLENGNTSPFATAVAVAKTTDWDDDGIPNAQEDLNHDGSLDVGETDPRRADTDGDGLTDGDELLRRLNPRNADSDGDCLPDGLEAGVTKDKLPAWNRAPGSVLERPRIVLAPACDEALRKRGVLLLANANPWDPLQPASAANLASLYDMDPTTTTDPTSQDSDRDGLSDGAEDWNLDGEKTAENQSPVAGRRSPVKPDNEIEWLETDPTRADSDGDGALDGEEGDRNNDGVLGSSETDPLLSDTDGDGIDDATEVRKHGSQPNECDSDGDGLADGLEAGLMNPHPARKECLGLQTAGSNFASIGALQILNTDSDNDGLPDGAEDENHNGWCDLHETDPTTADTDGDGLSDYIEMTGDRDRDGITDVDISRINNGPKCAPPPTFQDIDCDGVINSVDDDSDNDGCPDKSEADGTDLNGVPSAFTAKVKACAKPSTSSEAGGGTTGGGSAPTGPAAPTAASEEADYFSRQYRGGGGCSLVPPSFVRRGWGR